MKLSVAWIFDHIDADWKTLSITQLIDCFNQTVAEIEGYQKVVTDFKPFTYAVVLTRDKEEIIVRSSEWEKDIVMPFREDVRIGYGYLIKKIGNNTYDWAGIEEFCTSRTGSIPAIRITEDTHQVWKHSAETEDYIIDIDNKSINHRPDLWGHRGIAREIAALLELELKPLPSLIVQKESIIHAQRAPADEQNSLSITLETSDCTRFAGLYIDQIKNEPSAWWMAMRLMRVGARPLNMIVDATNYVMFDIGQPLHAFDGERLVQQKVIIRNARQGERLFLLKNEEIVLSAADIIVADGKGPISLAGIRGGKESGVQDDTTNILIESAHFDATTIRQTSRRVKLRTESSARFEKNLDPHQIETAIMRFIKLLDDEHITYHAQDAIAVVGNLPPQKIIIVPHAVIEARLGISLEQQYALTLLRKLEFVVSSHHNEYHITVPSFRATKDINLPEDIIEEIGRFFGYTHIPYQLPERTMAPFSTTEVDRKRMIKQFFAYAHAMREVANYAFYDERLLYQMQWQPRETIIVDNPQSEHWKQLVTSLIPHLIKNVIENKECTSSRFFEWARRWRLIDKKAKEQQVIATLIFDRKHGVDFYESKEILRELALLLGTSFEWVSISEIEAKKLSIKGLEMFPRERWDHETQTAYIMHNDTIIGKAGKISSSFLHPLIEGDAFISELDADYLRTLQVVRKLYKPLSKYPSIHRDISLMVPSSVTVDTLERSILAVDERVEQVCLVDQFEKKEWGDQKSLTFSIMLVDYHATLTSHDADTILTNIMNTLSSLGAHTR